MVALQNIRNTIFLSSILLNNLQDLFYRLNSRKNWFKNILLLVRQNAVAWAQGSCSNRRLMGLLPLLDRTGLDFEGLELSGDATEHEWFNWRIDLLSLYVLFSQYRSRVNSLESCYFSVNFVSFTCVFAITVMHFLFHFFLITDMFVNKGFTVRKCVYSVGFSIYGPMV